MQRRHADDLAKPTLVLLRRRILLLRRLPARKVGVRAEADALLLDEALDKPARAQHEHPQLQSASTIAQHRLVSMMAWHKQRSTRSNCLLFVW